MELSQTASRQATRPPALIVRLDRRPRVQIVAADFFEEEAARPFAELVEHVLANALTRQAGSA